MASEFTVVTNPTVHVFVTSSVSTFQSERRFQKDLTIAALKGKLELVCGAASGSMMLDVFNKDNELVCKLDNDEALLGSYPIDDEMRIHVIDKSGKIGEFEDVSKVEKFEISEDEYKKRTDSVRAYKQRMKMGQFREISEEEQRQIEEEKRKKAEAETVKLNSIHINDRCEVRLANQPPRRGTVKYVGNTDFKPGNWVGVQYDEPMGKNDGSVQGKRYFECPPKYGGFVKPGDLETGDFPELDIDDEMDEM